MLMARVLESSAFASFAGFRGSANEGSKRREKILRTYLLGAHSSRRPVSAAAVILLLLYAWRTLLP